LVRGLAEQLRDNVRSDWVSRVATALEISRGARHFATVAGEEFICIVQDVVR